MRCLKSINHWRQSNNYTCAFCVQHTNESSCPKSVLRVRDYRGSLIKGLPAGRGRPLRGREKFALGDSKPIIILSPQALLLNWKLQTRFFFLKRDIHVEISGTACSHFRPLLSTVSSVLSTLSLLCRRLVWLFLILDFCCLFLWFSWTLNVSVFGSCQFCQLEELDVLSGITSGQRSGQILK